MREIKFRVWDKHNKKFFFVSHGRMTINDKDAIVFDTDKIPYCDDSLGREEDIVIQQFIGLKDKNNKEIYEGDDVIVKYSDATPEGRIDIEWTYPKQIRWINVLHGFRVGNCEQIPDNSADIEIVGHIYDSI